MGPTTSATDAIGLTKAAFDLINSSNPINKLAISLVKWLGRECINEDDFNYCVDTCRGLAYPNTLGLQIREQILKSQKKALKAGGIQLVLSGTVGRWMAFTQEHVYMVTTVAVITAFHHPDIAKEILTEMAMGSLAAIPSSQDYFSYSVDKARIDGVLPKFVDSIYSNVIAAGHTLGTLPEALQSYCVHLMKPKNFADVARTVAKSSVDMMLLSGVFLGDLLLWVLTHFEGRVIVSIAGSQVYNREPLAGTNTFTMAVASHCKGQSCRSTMQEVELLELFDYKWNSNYQGKYVFDNVPVASHRQQLYGLERPDLGSLLNTEEKLEAYNFASRFMNWVFAQSVISSSAHRFDFKVVSNAGEGGTLIGDILFRMPKIIIEFSTPSVTTDDISASSQFMVRSTSSAEYTHPLDDLVGAFPDFQRLILKAMQRCCCSVCQSTRGNTSSVSVAPSFMHPTCIGLSVVRGTLLLIAHAIADAFGASDAAGENPSCCIDFLVQLLTELCHKTVTWTRWFGLTTAVVLGHASDWRKIDYKHPLQGEPVAMQYGSMVVAARWLDQSRSCGKHQCFAVDICEGQIPGAEQTSAFAFTRETMKLQTNTRDAVHPQRLLDTGRLSNAIFETDPTQAEIKYAILGTPNPFLFHLITYITAGKSSRQIDPADAVRGHVRSLNLNTSKSPCHEHDDTQMGDTVPKFEDCLLSVWDFSQLLKNWSPHDSREYFLTEEETGYTHDKNIFLSTALDTDLKVNIAVALAVNRCIIAPTKCCVYCLLFLIKKHQQDLDGVIFYDFPTNALVHRGRH